MKKHSLPLPNVTFMAYFPVKMAKRALTGVTQLVGRSRSAKHKVTSSIPR